MGKIAKSFQKMAEILVVAALVGELAVMFCNVVERSLFSSSLLWGLEVSEVALAIIAFVGGALAYPRGEHMAFNLLIDRLAGRWRMAADALVNGQVLLVSILGIWLAVAMMISKWDDRTPYLGLSMVWFALPMALGFLFLCVFALERLTKLPTKIAAGVSAAVALIVAAIIVIIQTVGLSALGLSPLGLTFVLLAFQLLAGVPIGFVLLLVSAFYLYGSKTVPLSVVPVNMFHGISSFVMLAIPFFILAGYIMTEGGLTKRLTRFIISVVGGIRGGLLQVIIVAMYVMSGISGSKIADIAAVGTTMKEEMKENNYAPGETGALLSAAAIMGETVPPSIAMLVLASVTSLSVGTMFVAGLLPALVLAACLMVLVYVRARNASTIKTSGKKMLTTGLAAIPAVFAPLILVGGIVTGIATPTEVSSSAVVYALILSVFFYRELKREALWNSLLETAAKSGMILFIASTASSLSWSLTLARMPQQIAESLSVLQGSPWLFMLGVIVTLVIMGAVLEGIPALMIFGPLLVPLAPLFGIDPLQFGLVLVIAMGFGAFSPPLGVGFYCTCSLMESTFGETARHMLPYLVVLTVGLLLVAYVPWFTLVVPRMFHMIP